MLLINYCYEQTRQKCSIHTTSTNYVNMQVTVCKHKVPGLTVRVVACSLDTLLPLDKQLCTYHLLACVHTTLFLPKNTDLSLPFVCPFCAPFEV